MTTKKISAKQLKEMIEKIAAQVVAEQRRPAKKLREKMELGRMGARPGQKMSFDQWEAGAATSDEDVVNHMREKHAGDMKSEMDWAKLYNSYEDAFGGGSHFGV
jgi:hypothetical protein